MATISLRREEGVGLVLALAAHAGLLAFLVWRPPGETIMPPERMTVTLSDDVGLTSTSPEPAAEAQAEAAPELGEPAPPEPQAFEPAPAPKAEPRPAPAVRPAPRKVEQPVARPQPKPEPQPSPRQRTAPPRPAPKTTPKQAGASNFADAFKEGIPASRSTGTSRNPPAERAGPAVQASLASAISRQLKPRWAAPQGPESEKLVTILSWSLNRDGSLAGAPRVVRQDGITDTNRPQAARHAEQAVRAVQLAAPFDLPEQYYDAWKRVASFRFDRRLSQ